MNIPQLLKKKLLMEQILDHEEFKWYTPLTPGSLLCRDKPVNYIIVFATERDGVDVYVQQEPHFEFVHDFESPNTVQIEVNNEQVSTEG